MSEITISLSDRKAPRDPWQVNDPLNWFKESLKGQLPIADLGLQITTQLSPSVPTLTLQDSAVFSPQEGSVGLVWHGPPPVSAKSK